MRKVFILLGVSLICLISAAVPGYSAGLDDCQVMAQRSGGDTAQGQAPEQAQPMTRSQDWPNVQGQGAPYGTSTQQSTTPGYPMKGQQGEPYGTPGTPSKQQGGSDMGSQAWPNVQGQGAPYGTSTQQSTTPGYPMKEQQGEPYGAPETPARQQGGTR